VIDQAFGLGIIGPAPGATGGGGQGGWNFTSGVALSATYSDNADLTTNGRSGQEELFLQVLPYFALDGQGARVKARGYYAPALYTGTIGDTSPSIDNFLSLSGTVEVTPDKFFVDGYATASMVNQNASGPGGGIPNQSYQYKSDNLTQAFGFSLSPYVRHHLGSTADFLARASIGTTTYADSSGNNSVNASFIAGFTSGRDFQRVPWGLSYSISKVNFNDSSTAYGDSNTYQAITGRASYVISPVWRVDTSLGYALNDYETTSGQKSGPTWSLGGTWTPNPRVGLSLGYGGQPYGDSWYLNYRHALRRANWFATYSSQLTTVQQEFMRSQPVVQTDPSGLPAIDPVTGLPIQVTRIDPTLTNQTYLLDTFLAGISWTGNRTTVGLDANWNQRDYQVSGQSQQDWGVGGRISRKVAADVTATARVGWTSYENLRTASFPSSGDNKSDNGKGNTNSLGDNSSSWDAGLVLTKQLSERSSVSGIYRYVSDVGAYGPGTNGNRAETGASGPENRITLVFNHSF
jgi:uncharacterized protein (PEP-CTERM system associated)